jgi:hypothetical protein
LVNVDGAEFFIADGGDWSGQIQRGGAAAFFDTKDAQTVEITVTAENLTAFRAGIRYDGEMLELLDALPAYFSTEVTRRKFAEGASFQTQAGQVSGYAASRRVSENHLLFLSGLLGREARSGADALKLKFGVKRRGTTGVFLERIEAVVEENGENTAAIVPEVGVLTEIKGGS